MSMHPLIIVKHLSCFVEIVVISVSNVTRCLSSILIGNPAYSQCYGDHFLNCHPGSAFHFGCLLTV